MAKLSFKKWCQLLHLKKAVKNSILRYCNNIIKDLKVNMTLTIQNSGEFYDRLQFFKENKLKIERTQF